LVVASEGPAQEVSRARIVGGLHGPALSPSERPRPEGDRSFRTKPPRRGRSIHPSSRTTSKREAAPAGFRLTIQPCRRGSPQGPTDFFGEFRSLSAPARLEAPN